MSALGQQRTSPAYLVLLQLDQTAEAEKLFNRAIELLRLGAGTETPALATVMENLADLQERMDRQKEADELRAQATEINTKVFGRYRAPVLPAARLPVWIQDLQSIKRASRAPRAWNFSPV